MTPWCRASDGELLGALGEAQAGLNALWSQMLPLIAEVEERRLASEHGCRDTAELLQQTQNVRMSTARARVDAARDVVARLSVSGTELPVALPALAAVVAEAAVSEEHVRVVRAVLAMVPPHLEEHRPSLEADLAAYSRTLDPDAVGKLGRRALAVLDPDGPRPRAGDATRTRFAFRPLGNGFDARGWFTTEDAAIVRTALSPLSAPAPADDTGERDTRSAAERLGDGLVELALRSLDAATLPGEGGQRPHVTITLPLSALTGDGTGSALLDFGDGTLPDAINAEQARRWACDAEIIPIVLGAAGEPLDVGRSQRLVNRAMRRALEQRDGGCAFPGCECPAQWASAHHIRHWADGGATALTNLVLLCTRHHTVVHRGEWSITMDGGFPLFHPPPWIPGGARRNIIHRPDLVGQGTSPPVRPPVRVADLDAVAA